MNKVELMSQINDELINLNKSPLYEYRIENNYQPVIGEGDLDAKLMFIGEAPGKKEAETGKPFCGASGRMLDKLLDSINLDRDKVYITNVVKDRPPKNRDPKSEEIQLYTPFLRRQIDVVNPKIVATLGRFAMEFMFKNFHNDQKTYDQTSIIPKISEAHGEAFNLKTLKGDDLTLVPLYHPAYALYNPNNRDVLLNDFQIIKDLIG